MPGPGYKLTPPGLMDQMEDQLILNIVSRNRSALDGKYYTYAHGLIVEEGEVSEIEINTSVVSPAVLGRAIESLVNKMAEI